MTTYLIRRFSQMFLVLFISTIVIFLILSFVPGGSLDELRLVADPRRRPSESDINRMKAAMGLDKPWYLQYVTWLAGDTWLGSVGFPPRRSVLPAAGRCHCAARLCAAGARHD